MEATSQNIPELPVETENIRRNSNPTGDIKILQPELILENAGIKPGIVFPKPSPDLHEDIKNESVFKRVDSDSKFGVMETIPLELPGQEIVPSSPAPTSSAEKSENLTLQIRSISLNEQSLQTEQGVTIQQRPYSATECDANVLSKYFSLNPPENSKMNVEGVEFFNALSGNTKGITSGNSSNFTHSQNLPSESIDIRRNIEVAQEAVKDSVDEREPKNPPPILLKFFTEDKSGKDIDGKAFFDKIADEKLPGESTILEIKEDILSAASTPSQFLCSPIPNNEIEEAWIPSERTRQILISVLTTPAFVPDKCHLTMPGVIIDEEMDDPVKLLLTECNSPLAQQRKVLTANDVSEDECGLQKLIEADCYHAAINLTKRLLKLCGQGPGDDGKPSKHTPLSLRLWYTRLALLVKLRKFSLAEVESAAFGDLDKADLYYEFYPDIYKGKRGTMVPFSFRLLLAELPQYQGNHQVALDNMYCVLNVIQRILINIENGYAEDGSMIELSASRKKASLEIWSKRERRILYSILNCVLSQKDYILAVSVANILMNKNEENAPELQSAIGRIYLQLGDVKCAQECFTKASMLGQGSPDFQAEEKINKALLAIAHNNSEEAYKYYQQAYTLCPNNAMLANNMAVCLLYMGRLKESLSLLENTIHSSPSSCQHDGILFNTCTLYELESSRCTQKKIAMLELVSKYVGDGFNVSCLKIQPVAKA